jgi:TraM recognition site of TraD and TraG/Type IV secretory system Conjugative DNA transfer
VSEAQTTQAAQTAGHAAADWVIANSGLVVVLLLAFALALKLSGRRRRGPRQAAQALRQPAEAHARQQGRVTADELARLLPMPKDGHGVPLGYTGGKKPRAAGLPWDADKGHVGVFGPTRSGKGFHATDALVRWPGPAIVADPKSEQWRRTAGLRAARYGPVYRIPPGGVDLAALFDLGDPLARRELYDCLLQPWRDRDPFWLEKTYPLFEAAHLTGRATGAHPLQLLARWVRLPAGDAVREAKPHAPAAVALVTGGRDPDALNDRGPFESAWATFTARLVPLAEQIRHLALPEAEGGIPARWADARATIYLTFPLHQQKAVGPLTAAIVAGLLRGLEAAPPPHRTLLALDEAPAVGLPHLSTYLATIGGLGSGVTAVVYCQSLSQLEAVYGRPEREAIVNNCSAGQVFFAPRDLQTAEYLSRLFGDELEPVATASGGEQSGTTHGAGSWGSHNAGRSTSWTVSTRYRRALTEAQAMALPERAVAVFAAGKRALLADSLGVVAPRLAQLPPPPPPAAPVPAAAPTGHPAPPPPDGGTAPAPPGAPGMPSKPGETGPPAGAGGLW